MKNGSTPNPARDAAETKEAYIVVEIMDNGSYGDSNLFFNAISAVIHICSNPPIADHLFDNAHSIKNFDDFLFRALPEFYAKHDGEDILHYQIRKISLSHQQQDGSAPQLDQITLQPEAQPEIPRESYTMRTPEKMAEVVAAIDPFQTAAMSKFLVVSYDSDQQQWFYDFVIAATDENAQAALPQFIDAAHTQQDFLPKGGAA